MHALRKRTGGDSFAAAWDLAVEMGLDGALDLAIKRGIEGQHQAVFYRGVQVGKRIRFDNRLLLRALTVLDRREGGSFDFSRPDF